MCPNRKERRYRKYQAERNLTKRECPYCSSNVVYKIAVYDLVDNCSNKLCNIKSDVVQCADCGTVFTIQ